ncbi:unnamed protein product [Prorocentrum cordatum]|uniref:Pentacotripeptide-repeat region of PRORP domain-containing protein n=1 Tax=Prorocentrum cordatum TaxID=2364126 RepID=A0ABN9XE88_9DINO|nr:unnamed protein product [Polarella glacialis]
MRKGRAVAVGFGATQRDVAGEAGAHFSYNAATSACEKGKRWQQALLLISEMQQAKLEPDVIRYSAGISACEKGEQWQRALALLSEMRQAKLEPNLITYNAGISACEKGEQWQRALGLLSEVWEAKLEPSVILQRWDQRVREGQAVAAVFGAAQRDARGEAEARLSPTTQGSARARRARSGSGLWRCLSTCGSRS